MSNYVHFIALEVSSSAIVIIDSSDGIDKEDEDGEILRDIGILILPVHMRMSTPTVWVSMPLIKATTYRSDGECVDNKLNMGKDICEYPCKCVGVP